MIASVFGTFQRKEISTRSMKILGSYMKISQMFTVRELKTRENSH